MEVKQQQTQKQVMEVKYKQTPIGRSVKGNLNQRSITGPTDRNGIYFIISYISVSPLCDSIQYYIKEEVVNINHQQPSSHN